MDATKQQNRRRHLLQYVCLGSRCAWKRLKCQHAVLFRRLERRTRRADAFATCARSNLLRLDNPVVSRTGLAKALVILFADGKARGTGRVYENRNWSILTDTLGEGAHTFTATQVNEGCRTSAVSAAATATATATATVALQPGAGLKFAVSSLIGTITQLTGRTSKTCSTTQPLGSMKCLMRTRRARSQSTSGTSGLLPLLQVQAR